MKRTIKAITLTAVLAFGTTVSLADGIIIGDRTEGIIIGDRSEKVCTADTTGIIIGDRTESFFGRVVRSIFGETKDTCSEKDGIIIGDRDGIIIGDRAGIIIGD